MAPPQHWLVKSEPDVYGYAQLEADERAAWTGIRNFEARNHLRAMRPGDLVLYYHTGKEKAVVGVARVVSAPGPDATAPGEDWSSVDVAPVRRLSHPVSLERIKATKTLASFALVKRGRLSVMPVSSAHFARVLALGATQRKRSLH